MWCGVVSGSEEELGSSEESGKDWDELEEEARRGECCKICLCTRARTVHKLTIQYV